MAEKVGQVPGVSWNAWYLDNGNVITTVAGAKLIVDMLLSEGPHHGLYLNLSKTSITGHNLSPAHLEASGLPDHLLHSAPGLENSPTATVLGTPVGPEPFIQLQMAPIFGKVARLCRAVGHLRDPQVALLLLRQSLGICRVTHILRTADPTLIALQLEALDSMYLNTARYLFSRLLRSLSLIPGFRQGSPSSAGVWV